MKGERKAKRLTIEEKAGCDFDSPFPFNLSPLT
jgi:hypothetical protein